jgi:hypothetical protein
MRATTAARIAWPVALLSIALGLAACVVAGLNGDSVVTFLEAHQGIGLTIALSFPFVGTLIVTRDRRNAIGWIMVGTGLCLGLYIFSGEVAEYTRARGVVGELTNWLSAWINLVGIVASSTYLFLLFPDGRLPSRRWRPLLWLVVLVNVAGPLTVAVLAWPERSSISGEGFDGGLTGAVWGATFSAALLLALPCIVATFVRLRRARGVLRQQMKWFVYLAIATLPLGFLGQLPGLIGPLFEILQFWLLLGGIAIGIFRYRLWDIDRILNRTLVYGLLTAILAGLYAVGVLVVGHAVSSTGRASSLVVAATTLAVAAAFQPLRRRIQRVVDRRFNRRRYDAARTIDAFASRLRDQVDLGTLRGDLLAVVDDTMSPATTGLWLRPERPGR